MYLWSQEFFAILDQSAGVKLKVTYAGIECHASVVSFTFFPEELEVQKSEMLMFLAAPNQPKYSPLVCCLKIKIGSQITQVIKQANSRFRAMAVFKNNFGF